MRSLDMGKKILIVDSDVLFSERLVKQLTKNIPDLAVSIASDGQEGFKKGRREKPDLFLIEDSLVSIDGYKLCRLFKFDKRYQSIPVILLTNNIDEQNKALANEVGADEFILRSAEVKILEKIKAYLER